MQKNIVCDASCLILLNRIDQLDLLQKVFGEIWITNIIAREIKIVNPEWMKIRNPSSVLQTGLVNLLDPGEASALSLAAELEDALLIIDEAKGRKVAKRMGIDITGTLGVIITAKNKGYISAVKPLLERIQVTNFRISSDLIRIVLESTNEN